MQGASYLRRWTGSVVPRQRSGSLLHDSLSKRTYFFILTSRNAIQSGKSHKFKTAAKKKNHGQNLKSTLGRWANSFNIARFSHVLWRCFISAVHLVVDDRNGSLVCVRPIVDQQRAPRLSDEGVIRCRSSQIFSFPDLNPDTHATCQKVILRKIKRR